MGPMGIARGHESCDGVVGAVDPEYESLRHVEFVSSPSQLLLLAPLLIRNTQGAGRTR